MITKDDFSKKIGSNKKEERPSYLNSLLFKIFIKSLIVVILFLLSLIYIRYDNKNKEQFHKVVYNNSLSFAKIYNVYKKYLGDAIPFKNIFKDNTKMVSDEKLFYSDIKKEGNGYVLDVAKEYLVNSISAGIVIKIEKSDKYNNIITIQDKDGLNISYGYLEVVNINLYDYVEKGELIGNCNNKLYLIFQKDDKYLSYEEYL